MINNLLFFVHYAFLLFFGILLSVIFAGVQLTKKNIGILFGLFTLSGCAQLILYDSFGEMTVWHIYPLIAHLPTILLLLFFYRKRIITALAAISTAYLCCQPAKWFGLLVAALTDSYAAEQIVRIFTLLVTASVAIFFLAPFISEIYNKDSRSVLIFGVVPMVYYLFDYSMSVYTSFWTSTSRAAMEFSPFLLCIVYMAFCVFYYKEYEKKTEAEQKEHLIRISLEQQAKEIDTIKRNEQEIRMLRHDMRMFMNNLAVCVEEGNTDAARRLISGFTRNIEATVVHRYCENATVNYIISDCAAKCQSNQIAFSTTVALNELNVDEISFSSILSNALDNAINAQMELPESERSIRLMLKTSESKLLLSVKNPFKSRPIFVDGIPVSHKKGHGYGTQSIRCMTQRLGGNYRFATEDNTFILQVVI